MPQKAKLGMKVSDEQESPLIPSDQTPVGLRVTPPTDFDVDGAGDMLRRIEAFLRSYLSFPDDRYYIPLALFAILQHCWYDCFDEVPYLSVSAMVKSAGKTRVLELLQFLGGDGKAVLLDGSVTLAALYTETDEKKVVLIDESERLQNPHSTFRPILNGGYRSGQTLKRKIGSEIKSFSIFCPKVFAQIGDVHDSLRDRCIVVEMQRTMSGSRMEYVRQFAKEEATDIAHAIEEALEGRVSEIRDAYLNYHNLYPTLGFLPDRDRELWKPLFALCQVFAPDQIHDLERSAADIAALKTVPPRRFEHLKGEEEKARKLEYAERLLRDVQSVVGDRERITTADLLKGLRDIGTSPWRTYEGTGITDISLAALLKPFGVEPKTIRVRPKGEPKSTAKGYCRTDMVARTMAAQVQPRVEPERDPVTHSAGELAAFSQPDVEPDRHPVTRVIAEEAKPCAVTARSLPILGQCGGCQDMHRGIAAKAEANPGWNDQQLSEDSGCSLTIVRQAKTRYLEWKQGKGETHSTVCLPRPASKGGSNYTIHQGNVLDILPTLPSDYFAGSLSDPPYELGFMGKKWDSSGIAFNPAFWTEMYRVLAPGAYVLAFGGTRTFHRLTCAIEDAGFEVRDHIMWLFGTGFPKSRATLKPGYEPVVMARKPAERGLLLNIDQCRINPGEVIQGGGANFGAWRRLEGREAISDKVPRPAHDKGRYPTNVILDEEAAAQLGGTGRFFYTPKSNRKERDAGLESFPAVPSYMVANGSNSNRVGGAPRTTAYRNPHPTVKPLALTKWLASLIKSEGNERLLVPFSGSGSEMIGGLQAGWDEVVGVELTEEYIPVAHARINYSLLKWNKEAA